MGILVVNALSRRVEVTVRRDGNVYEMAFEQAIKFRSDHHRHLWQAQYRHQRQILAGRKYFDSPKFSASRLVHILKAKAVLCPGLTIHFTIASISRCMTGAIKTACDYLLDNLKRPSVCRKQPFTGQFSADNSAQWIGRCAGYRKVAS